MKKVITTVYETMYQKDNNISFIEKSFISITTLFVLIVGLGFFFFN
ncbi:MAG: hypothetical protein QMB65_05270 [Vicingaceae bacterium]